jgi:Restriction Enzyme Adenine Methylase Associated
VDRGQLAQCLEYAGWARTTNLDELAGMYHRGEIDFFTDWQDFTGSDTPVRIRRSPRLILVARDFHGRTGSAFEFLIENGLPVKLIRVSIYEDQQERRFVDVEGEHEPEFPAGGADEGGTQVEDPTKIEGRRVRLTDLVDAGVLRPGHNLVWDRPQLGATYRATVTDQASLRLEDGRAFSAPSRAAIEAAGGGSYDGWYAWRVDDDRRESLHELRVRCVRALQRKGDEEEDGGDAGHETVEEGGDTGPVEASESRVADPVSNSGSGATERT